MANPATERALAALVRELDGRDRAPGELTAALGVTDRTLRSRVRLANERLRGAARIALAGGRYALSVEDGVAWAAWKTGNLGLWWGGSPATPRERASYLISDLLLRFDWVTLDELAATLFCSHRTISNDISAVKKRLAAFGLTLERRPHYGVRVQGSEVKRRVCLANNLLDRMRFEGAAHLGGPARPRGAGSAAWAGDFHLDVISACVDAAASAERFSINSVAYQNLLVHIAIAIIRIRAGSYAPVDAAFAKAGAETASWAVAARIAREIEARLGTELPSCEVAYIAMHLASKQALYLPVSMTPGGAPSLEPACRRVDCVLDEATGGPAARAALAGDGGVGEGGPPARSAADGPISDEVWSIASQMIEVVRQAFHFDFRLDVELRMNLARHIAPLSVRLRHRMRLDNPLLADIRARYPLAWSFAFESSRVLSQTFETKVSEDEIGYIALAFALALERQRARSWRPVSVLIVCASGMGSARLLAMRCREEFAGRIGDIRTCEPGQLDQIDFARIDYVFTTVPIARALPVPVREVGYFFDASDVDRVRELLRGARETSAAAAYLREGLFLPHVAARTREEAIATVCAAAAVAERIAPDFEELVRRREACSSTAFGNLVAMPHPLTAASEQTFVCVAVLDEVIDWDGADVAVIFLVAVSRDSSENLKALYEGLLDLVSDRGAIEQLRAHRSFDVLTRLLAGGGATAQAARDGPPRAARAQRRTRGGTP